MNRLVIVLLSLILAVLLVLLWQLRPGQPSPYVPIAVSALDQPAVSIALPEPVLDAPVPVPTEPPPWAASAGMDRPGADPARSPLGLPAESARRSEAETARLASIQQRLQQATLDGNPDPEQVISLLEELESVQGEPLPGGVDLAVLRQNLRVAGQMQRIAENVQQLVGDGSAAATEQTADSVQRQLEELAALQRQLRTDVIRAPSPGRDEP